jgi:hypothetical protein
VLNKCGAQGRRGNKKFLGKNGMLDSESLADILTVGDITRHHARIRPERVAIHYE